MEIVGYSDHWSVRPGDTLSFFVSTKHSQFDAALVRLIHGNTDPAGPGFREAEVESSFEGRYAGREQGYAQGSHVRVEGALIPESGSFTLQAWICPTAPARHPEAIVGCWSEPDARGYGLFLDEDGVANLWLGGAQGRFAVRCGEPLSAFRWRFVGAAYDAANERALVFSSAVGRTSLEGAAVAGEATPSLGWSRPQADLIIGACAARHATTHNFNGLIDSPRVFAEALDEARLRELHNGADPGLVSPSMVAAWDFAAEISSRRVVDLSPGGHHGEAVNLPRRGIPGWNWSGTEVDHRLAPGEHGAIAFHDEDMEDAGWERSFGFTIPGDLPSGVYAARLRAGDAEDHVPFFVRPAQGATTAKIAFLVPTYSYLAYANDHITWRNPAVPPPPGAVDNLCPEDVYSLEHRLKGLYDRYEDGTGCCFSSRLRPVVNMRPRYRLAVSGTPHQFGADLHLIDWLEAKGFEYDVITDEDLHAEGVSLLQPYNVVITGHHPEYTTVQMLNALEAYSASGGRLMYLGGNGFYWVISTEPDHPHVIEIRRGQRGTSTWRGREGEGVNTTTGEQGGLWRDRGRAPQRLVGVGMAAQGNGPAQPYRRLDESFDPRAGFIFEGVPASEPIGDFGLILGGAGGVEVDRFDHALGTPPHALLLATTETFNDDYQHVVEEVETSDSKQGGSENPNVRGDMTFFETPAGGAVFSVGSMAWVGSLSHTNYENNVSRITANVLRRFASDEPFEA